MVGVSNSNTIKYNGTSELIKLRFWQYIDYYRMPGGEVSIDHFYNRMTDDQRRDWLNGLTQDPKYLTLEEWMGVLGINTDGVHDGTTMEITYTGLKEAPTETISTIDQDRAEYEAILRAHPAPIPIPGESGGPPVSSNSNTNTNTNETNGATTAVSTLEDCRSNCMALQEEKKKKCQEEKEKLQKEMEERMKAVGCECNGTSNYSGCNCENTQTYNSNCGGCGCKCQGYNNWGGCGGCGYGYNNNGGGCGCGGGW